MSAHRCDFFPSAARADAMLCIRHRPFVAHLAVALAVVLASAGIEPHPAQAGPYTVMACDAAAGSANRIFSVQRSAPVSELTAFTSCPSSTPDPYGDMTQGIGVYDNFATAYPPSDGRFAEQRFTAPDGTTITAASITRDIGNRSGFWRNYARLDGLDQPSETCYRGSGEAFCRIVGTKVYAGLSAQTLAYGARCDTAEVSCTNGSTLHMVWATILSASITLDDTEAPTVSAPTATGLADGEWHRGAGTITFDAEDNTGVRIRRVLEGSTERATAVAAGCADSGGDAFTYAQPCAGSRGLNGTQSVSVADVCAWGDGEHAIRAAAVDTGGTQTASTGTATVRADCTAPTVSVGPGSERSVDAGEAIAPQVTASDARVAVASQEVQYQVGVSGTWKTYTGPITAQAQSSYRFRARATDALGNTSAWSSPSAWTHGVWTETVGELEASPPQQQPASDTIATTTAPPATGQQLEQEIAPTPPLLSFRAPSARVTSSTFTRKTRTLRVKGTATNAASVTLTIRTNAKTPLVRKVKVRNGRFGLAIRLPKRTRRARVIRIRVQPLR